MAIYKVISLALVFTIVLVFCMANIVFAQNLIRQALKLFGISYVVRQFGPQINSFINNLTGQRGVKWEGTTKVVPIFSIGAGAFVGATQVQGPPDLVNNVRAVGQVETRIGGIRGKLLIPTNTSNPTANITRIRGVGISALIDFKI